MDIDAFKGNVLAAINESKIIADSLSNQEYVKQFRALMFSLGFLSEFLEDEFNISVLKKYCINSDGASKKCPLELVCRNVWKKLEEIGQFLRANNFNSIRNNISQINTGHMPYNSHSIFQLINRLNEDAFKNLLAAYEVLKHLDGHNKTLIILGPNGSGKTSFANFLKQLDKHVKVIPASKPINAVGHIPSMYNSSLANYNDELYKGGILSENLLQKLIVGMCSEHDDIARKFHATKIFEKKSIYEKVKEIFDEFFEVKLDNSAFSVKVMNAKKLGGEAFDFNNMSDGERVAFFYIATVIAAPEQSFIIVDEPENHLNPAIYNKIWEKLIDQRKDCQFIFISHTIEFVSARTNFELCKIKNFVYPNKFEFDFLGDTLDNIQSELIIEILGSRKTILFCEGSKSDYDYRVYERLFGEKYTIVPAGNSSSVVRSVEACNLHAMNYNIQKAIGIVDSDLKSNDEIERLRKKQIYTLGCNEIEMLLIDEAIFKKALERVFKKDSCFEDFKNSFFDHLEERKTYIIKRLVKTQVDESLKNAIIDDKTNRTKEDIRNNFSSIINNINIDKLWEEKESILTSIISKKKYEEALRICCLEHGEIISGLGNKIIPNYAAIALGVLREDSQLSIQLRNQYFPEISM